MARVNLLDPNSSFKSNSTGWAATGTGTTISQITTTLSYIGDSCLQVTKGSGANAGAVTSTRVPVSAGTQYAAAGYVFVPPGQEAGAFRIDVTWYTALTSGTLIMVSSSSLLSIYDGFGWVRLTALVTAPSGAVGATYAVVQPAAGTAGKIFYTDAEMFEAATYVGEYFSTLTQGEKDQAVLVGLTPTPTPIFRVNKGLNADISLGNLVFNTIDEDGVVWIITDIQGWWEHPEPEMRDIPRGYGDGSYDVRGRYMARSISLVGSFLPPSPAYVAKARAKLIAASDLVYTGDWLKTDESPVKAAWVRLSGKPNIQTVNDRGRTDFSIGLRAPDPLKYEWWDGDEFGYKNIVIPCANSSTLAQGQGVVNNIGNGYTSCVLQVTGPITGPATITNMTTNESITIISSLRDAITKTVTNKAITTNEATLTTSTAHGFAIGDNLVISGVDSIFNGIATIDSIPSTTTFTYYLLHADVASTAASGTAFHAADVIELDTLNHSVTYDGYTAGYRSMVDILAQWTLMAPGANLFSFYDSGNVNSTASLAIYYRSAWLG